MSFSPKDSDELLEGSPDTADAIIPLSEVLPLPHSVRTSFADYKTDARSWITLVTGEYYPDILKDACDLYEPVLKTFGKFLTKSESSVRLFLNIAEIKQTWMRIQVARVFKKYVSPETPVEMLKQKRKAQWITENFGNKFRPINEVQKAFDSRLLRDEALCAILWEYKDRGKKGYDLTTRFFEIFRAKFPNLEITGPERAGKDISLGKVFLNYPNPNRPVDFVIYDGVEVLAIGLARYDSDRGGAQEDDRTGGYANCADEILSYTKAHSLKTKVMFMNDGPGLLLGSMWNDYAKLETRWHGKIMVFTLRMFAERVTFDWLHS